MAFTEAALRFFRGLERNNDRQWFEAHRDDYEREVREPMRALIDEMDVRLARFYFHLQTRGRSMVGAGLWMPPRPMLNTIRDAIADDHVGFERMVRSLPKRFEGLDQEHGMLKRVPRGFAADHPAAQVAQVSVLHDGPDAR